MHSRFRGRRLCQLSDVSAIGGCAGFGGTSCSQCGQSFPTAVPALSRSQCVATNSWLAGRVLTNCAPGFLSCLSAATDYYSFPSCTYCLASSSCSARGSKQHNSVAQSSFCSLVHPSALQLFPARCGPACSLLCVGITRLRSVPPVALPRLLFTTTLHFRAPLLVFVCSVQRRRHLLLQRRRDWLNLQPVVSPCCVLLCSLSATSRTTRHFTLIQILRARYHFVAQPGGILRQHLRRLSR
jgi:hypothetical protein